MKVLIACEFSGTVRDAFRLRGHEAWSCDILPTEGNPDFNKYHIQGDAIEVIDGGGFDMIIAHPPCTFLTVTGNKWMKPEFKDRFPTRAQDRKDAIDFFMKFVNAKCDKIAIENPIGVMSTNYKKPSQIIQPFQFGDPERKSTCLWLKGLPNLIPTNIVEPEIVIHASGKTDSKWHYETMKLAPHDRMKARSKTFKGIAEAMADQWGSL